MLQRLLKEQLRVSRRNPNLVRNGLPLCVDHNLSSVQSSIAKLTEMLSRLEATAEADLRDLFIRLEHMSISVELLRKLLSETMDVK